MKGMKIGQTSCKSTGLQVVKFQYLIESRGRYFRSNLLLDVTTILKILIVNFQYNKKNYFYFHGAAFGLMKISIRIIFFFSKFSFFIFCFKQHYSHRLFFAKKFLDVRLGLETFSVINKWVSYQFYFIFLFFYHFIFIH